MEDNPLGTKFQPQQGCNVNHKLPTSNTMSCGHTTFSHSVFTPLTIFLNKHLEHRTWDIHMSIPPALTFSLWAHGKWLVSTGSSKTRPVQGTPGDASHLKTLQMCKYLGHQHKWLETRNHFTECCVAHSKPHGSHKGNPAFHRCEGMH